MARVQQRDVRAVYPNRPVKPAEHVPTQRVEFVCPVRHGKDHAATGEFDRLGEFQCHSDSPQRL